ncbi:MAG TPA: hypothetical protein VGU02_15330, partial [Gaiellaceae bacterium]|nr:hypothetical protein [Gaiellaceae bacterium]
MDATDAALSAETPRRLLFFLYHAGYLRHYREPIRLLAREGHVVHLAFTVIEKDAGDTVLAEQLAAEFPGQVTFEKAPTRGYFDGWRRTAALVRAFTDLTRYADPSYAEAPALQERMATKIKLHVLSGKTDPLSRALLVRAVDRLTIASDNRRAAHMRRWLVAAELAVPSSKRIERYMRAFQPDAVFVTPLVEYASAQVEFLKSARKLGIPTAACIASWDNLTNKGLLRFDPDLVVLWNEMQRAELERFHGVDGRKARVTGAQRWDEWFERRPTWSDAEFKERVGLRPDRPYALYVCSSRFIAPEEPPFVRDWIAALRASGDPALAELGVLVRPHPQNAHSWNGVEVSDLSNAVVYPRGGAQPDAGVERSEFFDSIFHSAAVVGVNTSAMVESAVVGKNVLTVLDPRFKGTQEGTLHFRYLLRDAGGFLNVAADLDEHLGQLRAAVAGGAAEEARVKTFVQSFVRPHGLDVAAAPLVAHAMLETTTLQ